MESINRRLGLFGERLGISPQHASPGARELDGRFASEILGLPDSDFETRTQLRQPPLILHCLELSVKFFFVDGIRWLGFRSFELVRAPQRAGRSAPKGQNPRGQSRTRLSVSGGCLCRL